MHTIGKAIAWIAGAALVVAPTCGFALSALADSPITTSGNATPAVALTLEQVQKIAPQCSDLIDANLGTALYSRTVMRGEQSKVELGTYTNSVNYNPELPQIFYDPEEACTSLSPTSNYFWAGSTFNSDPVYADGGLLNPGFIAAKGRSTVFVMTALSGPVGATFTDDPTGTTMTTGDTAPLPTDGSAPRGYTLFGDTEARLSKARFSTPGIYKVTYVAAQDTAGGWVYSDPKDFIFVVNSETDFAAIGEGVNLPVTLGSASQAVGMTPLPALTINASPIPFNVLINNGAETGSALPAIAVESVPVSVPATVSQSVFADETWLVYRNLTISTHGIRAEQATDGVDIQASDLVGTLPTGARMLLATDDGQVLDTANPTSSLHLAHNAETAVRVFYNGTGQVGTTISLRSTGVDGTNYRVEVPVKFDFTRLVPDPASQDTDGDGWSNAEELAAGSDPNNPLSTPEDLDGDGFSNVDEAAAGTDPRDSASAPGLAPQPAQPGTDEPAQPGEHETGTGTDNPGSGGHTSERTYTEAPDESSMDPQVNENGFPVVTSVEYDLTTDNTIEDITGGAVAGDDPNGPQGTDDRDDTDRSVTPIQRAGDTLTGGIGGSDFPELALQSGESVQQAQANWAKGTSSAVLGFGIATVLVGLSGVGVMMIRRPV
ncbi:MAG: thrombospondin type 3 repeat-containing protein [Varibaculum sp.]|nr:thrombospondin type 3 repeat-containing protein [Varibaculum sp.]